MISSAAELSSLWSDPSFDAGRLCVFFEPPWNPVS